MGASTLSPPLAAVRANIIACERCPRLRSYCQRIGREKRAAFRNETYWAKPVPGFGDTNARVAFIGLAPAAHGANRTGRNFTGDGGGGSGDFLMEAMHANGFANQTTSQRADDGLVLTDAWIAAVARCAPPDNKPTPGEIANCEPHLIAELAALPNLQVYVALGRIAFDAILRMFAKQGWKAAKRPVFEHGGVIRIPGAPVIVCAYHPSRQNTHTGRLTQAMLRSAFGKARRIAQTHLLTRSPEA
jgi:uracil-DNA glycosylase family 4